MNLRADVENDSTIDEDVKKFYFKQEIWWDGQFTAYQNMINILKGDK